MSTFPESRLHQEQQQAAPVQLHDLQPEIVAALQSFPLLSSAINHLSRRKDVAGPLANMLNANPHRLAVWEQQLERGELDVNGLKHKLVTRHWYNPSSYPRW